MDRHPYFTEIPRGSFEAIQFHGYLSEALLSLIVEPLEAEDVARSIREIYEGRIELVSENGVIDAPIRADDFADLGLKAFESMKITVSQWVMTTERASDALRALTTWDRRFGVWCACQVAREALRFVPEDEWRPLRAIETTEAWVMGRATLGDVRADSVGSGSAASAAAIDVDYAVSASADAASAAAYTASADVDIVADIAADAATWAADAAYWAFDEDSDESAELIRLREVVANACLIFPG